MNHSLKMFLSSGRFLPQLIKKFNKPNLDKEYLDYINSATVWKNDFKSSLPICAVYTHIHSFLDKCEINGGNAVDSDGKIRKVLFLGYDGMRADAAQKMLEMKNAYNKDLPSFTNEFGGISEVAKKGGIYLAYCGGYTDTLYQQSSDTAAGWTAQFTGKWGLNNGVKENDDTKKLSTKTVILEYAEKGLATSINFDWEPLFAVNLKSEINYVMAHSELNAKYIANCKRNLPSIPILTILSQSILSALVSATLLPVTARSTELMPAIALLSAFMIQSTAQVIQAAFQRIMTHISALL